MLGLLIVIGMMIRSSLNRRLLKTLWLPGLILLLMVIYSLIYAYPGQNRTFFQKAFAMSDFICISAIALWESLVIARVIVSNNDYPAISSLNAGLADDTFHARQTSAAGVRPKPEQIEKARNGTLVLPDGDTLLKVRPVIGGWFYWTEDISELRQRNERLAAVNRQMRIYLNNMERIVREREVLSAKTRLHNDLGQSLLAIEAYLAAPGGDRSALLQRLIKPIVLLQGDTPDERTDDRMTALLDTAKAVGVEIRIEGEIPQNWKELIEIAINECLTNTVKHADGHCLFVRIRKTERTLIVELTNDGKPPDGPVKETGGLANLRAFTERQGGEMTTESSPVFRLTLRLDLEGKYIYGLEGL